jgi:hypothetical protein
LRFTLGASCRDEREKVKNLGPAKLRERGQRGMNVKECKGEEKVRMVRSKKKKGCGETEPRPRPNGILTSLAPDAPFCKASTLAWRCYVIFNIFDFQVENLVFLSISFYIPLDTFDKKLAK